jgi:hypothetical protein
MSDLVERLRDWSRCTPVTCKEAAGEIERLDELADYRRTLLQHKDVEIERLRALLAKDVAEIIAHTIDRCARVADSVGTHPIALWIAAAIRASKDNT